MKGDPNPLASDNVLEFVLTVAFVTELKVLGAKTTSRMIQGLHYHIVRILKFNVPGFEYTYV